MSRGVRMEWCRFTLRKDANKPNDRRATQAWADGQAGRVESMSSSRRIEHGVAPGAGPISVVAIGSMDDIVVARERGRALGAAVGFASSDLTVIVTAISELAHNIVEYAQQGEIVVERAQKDGRTGVVIVASDEGPGIADVRGALASVAAPGQGAGLGLAGVRSLMDEFEIASKPRQGTTVTVRKWLP